MNPITIATPLGKMCACATERGICMFEFADDPAKTARRLKELEKYFGKAVESAAADTHLDRLTEELDRYFAGKLRGFTVSLDMAGTDFQKKAWNALVSIPYGQTVSYKQQAEATGNVKAVRAVALANSRNRVLIVVPCHRVIGSDGSLTGFNGGLDRKQRLLDLERTGKI